MANKENMKKKVKKYYVVERGRNKGIFDTWDACSEEVLGYRGARYQSYEDYEEAYGVAMMWLSNGNSYIIDLEGSRLTFDTYDEFIDELRKIEVSS